MICQLEDCAKDDIAGVYRLTGEKYIRFDDSILSVHCTVVFL